MDQEQDTGVKVVGYGGGTLRLEGVPHEASDILVGAFSGGHHWVRRDKDGGIEHVPSYKKLPGSTQDEEMLPFWSGGGTPNRPVQLNLFHALDGSEYHKHASPSIIIQHLCGYGYTTEKYVSEAKQLESWGFVCLRSQRDESGQFWELWFLPGVWAAKGELREIIYDSGKKNEKLKTKVAVEFIRVNSSFGTLDLSVQRLAQGIPD